jgi:hypothetical protein
MNRAGVELRGLRGRMKWRTIPSPIAGERSDQSCCDDELTQMVEEELARRKSGGACQ